MSDPIRQLEHDHAESLRYITDVLTALLAEVRGGARTAGEIHAEFSEALDEMCREVEEHFAMEDRDLFPLLLGAQPHLAEIIEGVQRSHRTLDDLVASLARLTQRGADAFVADLPAVTDLVQRFVSEYARHADEEKALLTRADREMTPEQKKALLHSLEGR